MTLPSGTISRATLVIWRLTLGVLVGLMAISMGGCEDDLKQRQNELEHRQIELDQQQAALKKEQEALKKQQAALTNPKLASPEEALREVRTNLKRIADGAAAFYMTDHYDITGLPLPATFPKAADWTPLKPCCLASPKDGLCDGQPSLWTTLGWHSVKFSLAEPHHFQYQTRFQKAPEPTFIIRGRGDPGCIGKSVVYEVRLTIDKGTHDIMTSKITQVP